MQSPFEGKQPLGIVYNTSMSRPDAALALALLYGFTGKRDARVGSVCVNGSGLNAAIFCDVVGRFYTPGPLRNGNQSLPPGLAADGQMPADPPMVLAAVEHAEYVRSVKKASDTSLAEAVLRNGIIFNAEAAVVLSAPATYLAKTLDLQGTKELFKQRVRNLVVVDSGMRQDVPAMRRILAEWPSPIVFCGREVGEALPFPATSIEKDFAWAPSNPVVDAYRAFKPMPYDAPSWDMAAMLYAVHPDKGFFQTQAGAIQVRDDGGMSFTAVNNGPHRTMVIDPAQKDKILETLIGIASAQPVVPQRFRPAK
jgi:hypothetical protein